LNIIKISILILCLWGTWQTELAAEIINSSEKQIIYNMLENNDFDSTSCSFLKDWSSDTKLKIPLVTEIINDPLLFPDLVSRLETNIETGDPEILLYDAAQILYGDFSWDMNTPSEQVISFKKNKDIFDYVINAWEKVEIIFLNSLKELTTEDLQKLIYLSYMIPMEAEDSLAYGEFFLENEITEFDHEIEDYVEVIEKVDFAGLMQAALTFDRSYQLLLKSLHDMEFNNTKKIIRRTRFGTFCIGTYKDDVYEDKYSLIIDPGGNDHYICDMSADQENSFFWSMDLAGDDLYRNGQISSGIQEEA